MIRAIPTVDFHGEQRSNATHESTTDPEARQARKGASKEAKLCYSAALMENRTACCRISRSSGPTGRPRAHCDLFYSRSRNRCHLNK
jgi:hypothetical protein